MRSTRRADDERQRRRAASFRRRKRRQVAPDGRCAGQPDLEGSPRPPRGRTRPPQRPGRGAACGGPALERRDEHPPVGIASCGDQSFIKQGARVCVVEHNQPAPVAGRESIEQIPRLHLLLLGSLVSRDPEARHLFDDGGECADHRTSVSGVHPDQDIVVRSSFGDRVLHYPAGTVGLAQAGAATSDTRRSAPSARSVQSPRRIREAGIRSLLHRTCPHESAAGCQSPPAGMCQVRRSDWQC